MDIQSWRQKFSSFSRKKQIILVVSFLHFFFLFSMSVDHWIFGRSLKPSSIVVNTVCLATPQPRLSTPQTKITDSRPMAQSPVTKNESIAKKLEPAAAAPKPENKKTTSLSTITNKLSLSSKKKEASLWQEIEKNLEAIKPSQAPLARKPSIQIPKLSLSVQTASTTSDEPSSIAATEQIAFFLQEMLQLPEFGEVRAKLWIDSSGHLAKFEILETKSQKNAEFLKNQLPTLQFPCLNEEASLTIVFRNA